MADFCSAKYNISFEERDELLMDYGELRGGSAADPWLTRRTQSHQQVKPPKLPKKKPDPDKKD